MEESAVCKKCGRYANSEGDEPCDPVELRTSPMIDAEPTARTAGLDRFPDVPAASRDNAEV